MSLSACFAPRGSPRCCFVCACRFHCSWRVVVLRGLEPLVSFVLFGEKEKIVCENNKEGPWPFSMIIRPMETVPYNFFLYIQYCRITICLFEVGVSTMFYYYFLVDHSHIGFYLILYRIGNLVVTLGNTRGSIHKYVSRTENCGVVFMRSGIHMHKITHKYIQNILHNSCQRAVFLFTADTDESVHRNPVPHGELWAGIGETLYTYKQNCEQIDVLSVVVC